MLSWCWDTSRGFIVWLASLCVFCRKSDFLATLHDSTDGNAGRCVGPPRGFRLNYLTITWSALKFCTTFVALRCILMTLMILWLFIQHHHKVRCGSGRNVSTSIAGIAMKFGPNLQAPPRMNCNKLWWCPDFSYHATIRSILSFLTTYLQN